MIWYPYTAAFFAS